MRPQTFSYLEIVTVGSTLIGVCQMLVQTQVGNLLPEFNNVISGRSTLYFCYGLSKCQCADACLQNSECYSFFYHKKTRRCQLHSTVLNIYTSGANFSTRPTTLSGSRYYQLRGYPAVGCPEWALKRNYVYNSTVNICYSIYNSRVPWYIAWDKCADDGGHLLLVEDITARDWESGLVGNEPPNDVLFVDGTDQMNEGDFKNFRNQSMTSVFWSGNTFDNYGGYDNCIALSAYSNNRLADVACYAMYAFVCQIDI